jgi:hypothetical protein
MHNNSIYGIMINIILSKIAVEVIYAEHIFG